MKIHIRCSASSIHQVRSATNSVASLRPTQFCSACALYEYGVIRNFLKPTSKKLFGPRSDLDSIFFDFLAPFIKHNHAECVVVVSVYQLAIVLFIRH